MAEEKKVKEVTLKYTMAEILAEIEDLERDEDVALFLRVQEGARKYKKHEELILIADKNS